MTRQEEPIAAPVVYRHDPTVLEHFRGCPAQRIETFDAKRPPHGTGGPVRITRCMDCGAQIADDSPSDETAA